MIRTREYLKSRFENGDVPTAEDYADLIDSFFHKNEQGEVSEGEEWPVSGKAVYEAIREAVREAIEGLDVASLVREAQEEVLPEMMEDYVKKATYNTAVAALAPKAWVELQLSAKADEEDLEERLEGVVTTEALTEALAEKADATEVAGKADATAVYSKTEADALLAGKASTTAVYTKQQIDAVVASRPTQTELAGELAGIPNSAAIAEIRSALNAVIARTNRLSHVACGSETLQVCLSDIDELEEPTR